jgi:predicted enzyme related to lactoylglutathione lyase
VVRSSEVGDLHVETVVVNVTDMERAVRFWCQALGYQVRETEYPPEFRTLVHPEGRQVSLSLQLADQPVVEPTPVHLDLYTSEQHRHIERLEALGASQVENWPYPADADFIVLRDPDGNEFCVIDKS